MATRLAVLTTLTAVATLLGACGGSDATASSNSTTASGAATVADSAFNDADVAFAQDMIPHHNQAIDMAAMAAGRSENPAILELAQRIQDAQDPEIEQMRSWLTAWGHDEMAAAMEGMDHGMAGMMSNDDMTALAETTGAEFDRLFAQMMIEHHQGAITMAQTVIADGTDPDAGALAEAIIVTQSAEIDEMQNLDLG